MGVAVNNGTAFSPTPATGLVGTDSFWTAKGQLAVATASSAALVLAVGSDGQVLTADSAQTSGVKWATPVSTYKPASLTSSTTSAGTPTIALGTSGADVSLDLTAQAAAITSMTSGITGTPANFQRLLVRIKDNGTPQTIAWGASYASRGATLPVVTVAGKVLTVGLIYRSASSTFDCVAVAQEA